MKRFVLICMTLAAGVTMYAQPRSVGLRLGTAVEVSYQHDLGKKNAVTIDAGFLYDVSVPSLYPTQYLKGDHPWRMGVEAVATYDWIFPITQWQKKGEWNWYVGVGGGLGYLRGGDDFTKLYNGAYDSGYIGAAARIGVEYNFWFPLQLSVDWRPVFAPVFVRPVYEDIKVGYYLSGLYSGACCINVRYKF